jgi:hypothetical protein
VRAVDAWRRLWCSLSVHAVCLRRADGIQMSWLDLSEFDLGAVLPDTVWKRFPAPRLMLTAEEDWEQAVSARGRRLADPNLFQSSDGRVWLLYSSGNDKGIGIVRLDGVDGAMKTGKRKQSDS